MTGTAYQSDLRALKGEVAAYAEAADRANDRAGAALLVLDNVAAEYGDVPAVSEVVARMRHALDEPEEVR